MSPQLTLQAPVDLPPAGAHRLPGEALEPGPRSLQRGLHLHPAGVATGLGGAASGAHRPAGRPRHRCGPQRTAGGGPGGRARPATCPPAPRPSRTELAWALGQQSGDHAIEDLRGQHVDAAISAFQPRRLITLAPTLNHGSPWKPWWPPTAPCRRKAPRRRLRRRGGAARRLRRAAAGPAVLLQATGARRSALLGVVERFPG